MNSTLFTHIRTTEERDKLLAEIEILLKSLYQEKGKGLETGLKSQVRFWVSEIVKEELQGDLSLAEKYFEDTKKTLLGFKVIKLTLAFEPNDISIDKFIEFVRRNVGENLILEFEYDPRLLGGATISYEGKYKDLSLKRLFDTEYEAMKADVMKIMYSR